MTTPHHDALKEQLGTVVLESAVLKFLATAEPDVKAAFSAFIEEHQDSPTLFSNLETVYPEFAQILDNEIEAMRTGMASIVKRKH